MHLGRTKVTGKLLARFGVEAPVPMLDATGEFVDSMAATTPNRTPSAKEADEADGLLGVLFA